MNLKQLNGSKTEGKPCLENLIHVAIYRDCEFAVAQQIVMGGKSNTSRTRNAFQHIFVNVQKKGPLMGESSIIPRTLCENNPVKTNLDFSLFVPHCLIVCTLNIPAALSKNKLEWTLRLFFNFRVLWFNCNERLLEECIRTDPLAFNINTPFHQPMAILNFALFCLLLVYPYYGALVVCLSVHRLGQKEQITLYSAPKCCH